MKMKTTPLRFAFLAGFLALAFLTGAKAADSAAPAPEAVVVTPATNPAPVVSTAPAAVKLPYGVEDILKLSRAQIGEDIILNYVQNTGTIYNLTPKDIVYLRDQGVSDKVIGAMLNQRKVVELAAQNASAQPGAVPPATTIPNAPMVPDANTVPPAPVYPDPNVAYSAPLTPPASTAYVIPYPAASYAYCGPSYAYYPYYYGGWYGPSISFGFGFGGRGHFHGGHGFGHGFAHGGHR